MSSLDSDDAIEKLAEYRKSSKNTETWLKTPNPQEVEDSPMRKFFLHSYWFNAVILLTAGFSVLSSGWSYFGGFMAILLTAICFILANQTFNTIDRLQRTNGRHTTVDDIFVVVVTMTSFLIFEPLVKVSTVSFISIHVTLIIFWLFQIVFVNFLKPKYGAGLKKIDSQSTSSGIGLLQRYFKQDRLISLAIAVVLTLVVYLI